MGIKIECIKGILSASFKIIKILIFHRKRCENCSCWTGQRCITLDGFNSLTGPMNTCPAWTKKQKKD